MIRTPNIPTEPKKPFSSKEYESEKEWLERKDQGKILVSHTEGGWLLVFSTALLISAIIGGALGTVIVLFTSNPLYLFISFLLVFTISIYFLRGDFSRIEIDPERGLILYEGTISFGGEYRSTRYRGPVQIIEGTHLVRFKRLRFLKSRPFIRFVTRSGYMRLNFKPQIEEEFLSALEKVGLVNISHMIDSLSKTPVRVEEKYVVFFEKTFDRTEFFSELKRKREARVHQERIEKRIMRKELIEKSKEFKQKTDESGQ